MRDLLFSSPPPLRAALRSAARVGSAAFAAECRAVTAGARSRCEVRHRGAGAFYCDYGYQIHIGTGTFVNVWLAA